MPGTTPPHTASSNPSCGCGNVSENHLFLCEIERRKEQGGKVEGGEEKEGKGMGGGGG